MIPDLVAYLKPNFFSRSTIGGTASAPLSSITSIMIWKRVFWTTTSLMKRWSLGSTELKRSRPTVVSKICPPNCWYFGVSVDSTFTMARKSMTPWSWALIASFGEEKNLPSPKAPGATFVIQYAPRAISSSFSDTTGSPEPGLRILLLAEIISLASICASSDSGTWTAIWSPSKSALNARQTSGWT